MSRTVRRKNGRGYSYGYINVLRDYRKVCYSDGEYEWYTWTYVHVDPKSKEGKKEIALFHSDAKTWGNGNGPGWFINEFIQRPYRRKAKNEIRKYLRDEDYEMMIEDKPKRIYWD